MSELIFYLMLLYFILGLVVFSILSISKPFIDVEKIAALFLVANFLYC